MNSAVIQVVCGYVVCVFLGGVAAKVLWLIWNDEIDLTHLVSEGNKQASMSRLQLMVFTFVIAISLFYLVERNGYFPWVSDGILTLLGISASTYAVGKGISYSREEGVTTPEERARTKEIVKSVSATGAAVVADTTGMASSGAPDPRV